MVKMEEHVRELESQLKDMYKGQIGNNQEMLKHVKENKDLIDRVRELEKKNTLYQDRLKEYEEIMNKMNEEGDKREALLKHVQSEYQGLKSTNNYLEG